MNRYLKDAFLVVLFVMLSFKLTAQKFTTHNVKQGESLEQVSKLYGVSIADILVYNKEVKEDQGLKANTILVIPKGNSGVRTESITVSDSRSSVDTDAREKPYGFTSHKVKKRETLYSISRRYNITEDDIKRYNRELYSQQLQKKMILRIPKYRRSAPSDAAKIIDMEDFETYMVAPKETRWSIAHKYDITIDSLLILNPDLSKTNDYLREGQELRVPVMPGSSLKNQVSETYTSYTVPAKMNFYQLEKKFGVKSEDIIRLNPKVNEAGGLKEGMVIRIPQQKIDASTVNTDNYIFYEIKPKQTEYNLTRNLGIGYKELLALNPALKDGLKAGMIIKLPKTQTGNFEVRNSLVLDKVNLLDSMNVANIPKLLFLLPFRTDRMDMSDKGSMEIMIQKRNDANASLGLYSGALVAIDSIADLGISIDIKTLDNELSLEKTKALLTKENLAGYSAIFGPLDAPSIQEVATRARASTGEVAVLAPIPVRSSISMPNVFFTYTQQPLLRNKLFTYLDSLAIDKNVIVIADSINNAVAKMIMQRFPEAKRVELLEEKKNISMDLEKFTELLSTEQENWVFLETENEKLVPSVSSILNSNNTKETRVRMLTTNRNKAFDNDAISVSHLSNLNFTYPSAYREVGNNSFTKRYEKRFKSRPDRFAVRGFDITFDLLLKLAYENDLFATSERVGETEYNGNKFSYRKDVSSGYYNTAGYIISYEDMRIREIKP